MANNDFFDDDLIRQRDRASRIKMGPGDEPAAASRTESADDGFSRPVSELNLTRMARHKQDADSQTTRAVQEIEALRKRQEQLEQEKRELEEFKRKSEEFERGKRDVVASLKRSLTAIERDELETQRIQELLESTRGRFKALLTGIEEIKEQNWSDDNIREELTRALGIIEDARLEYNKSVAKVDALKTERGRASAEAPAPVLFDDTGSSMESDRSFAHWFKVGLAISLPLIITLMVIAVFYAAFSITGVW
jgi:hypothetical protein